MITEAEIRSMVRKYKFITVISMAVLGLAYVVINWAMIKYSNYTMTGMNPLNFVFMITLLFTAVAGLCYLIEKVLIEIHCKNKD
ncbi:MAG: hypothetical protein MJK04_04035 [Psychrosphaera sp.]|nr:hypothetical protein [Psychrosphaera sp.]